MNGPALFAIYIPAGTIVLRLGRYPVGKIARPVAPVELLGDVYVDAARHDDGGYGYEVDGDLFFAAAATVTVLAEVTP